MPQPPNPLWQGMLAQAYQAKAKLLTGELPQIVLYNGGEGARSVTYTRTNIAQLDGWIAELEHKLGLRRRRAIAVRF